MDRIWDPLRRKEVALTPEEKVRQWFIGFLRDSAGVPEHQMMSEVELVCPDGPKVYRADIVVYGHGGRKLAIVECKRPEVAIDRSVLEQALRYNALLDVPFLFLTNGNSSYAIRVDGGRGEYLEKFPDYETMNV